MDHSIIRIIQNVTNYREKRVEFEKYIKEEKKGFDAFRLREVRDILTLDDLKEKVDTVNAIYETLEKCSKEAKAINIDEQLLQIDISNFQTLAVIIEKMDPVEKLWKTAYEFEKNHEIWMFGPFMDLNADIIKEEVENMSKVIGDPINFFFTF